MFSISRLGLAKQTGIFSVMFGTVYLKTSKVHRIISGIKARIKFKKKENTENARLLYKQQEVTYILEIIETSLIRISILKYIRLGLS